jgi:hypothetical protein
VRALFSLWLCCLVAGFAAAQEERPVLKRKPPAQSAPVPGEAKPAETKPAAEKEPEQPTTVRPVAPAATDPADPGAPHLRHGIPAPRPAAESAAAPEPAKPPAAAPAPLRVHIDNALTGDDPLITKSRQVSYEFLEKLPNFICDQLTMRMRSETRIPSFNMYDRVQLELTYLDGKEDYRNLRINGKPLKKGSPEDSGTWSTGEFGTVLADIFSSTTAASFTPRGEGGIRGVRAKIFDFKVLQPNSHWTIRIGKPIRPAFEGSLWIDPASGRVLRLEMRTKAFPADHEVDTVETVVDYSWVKIGGADFLMPLVSENLSCQRGSWYCTKNEIQFRNYRRFGAESQVLQVESEIKYDEEKKPAPPKKK